MTYKSVVKVTFNEDQPEASYHFIKRLIEKMLIDQLEIEPRLKAKLLMASKNIIEKG